MSPTKDNRKRKPSSTPSTGNASLSSQNGSPKVKISKPDLHLKLTKLEENEVKNRSVDEDEKFFQETCSNIRQLMAEALKTKLKNKTDKASPEVSELRVQASMQFLNLKKLNRLDKLRIKTSRDETSSAKSKVDSLHLQLQNLLYEVLHLQKEITKCQQFKSKDEDIELLSVNEFYKEAGKDISKPEITKKNEHLQRLARLEFENLQRNEMNETLKRFESNKAELENIIRTKREKLANLKPQLANILETTLPVQKYLNLPITEERDQINLSRYLPSSLFNLFKETRGYGEACDKNLCVKILGEVEEAMSFNSFDPSQDETNDDDDETNEGDEEDDSKKKRSGKGGALKHQMSRQDERLQKFLKCHPLQVQVKIKIADPGTTSVSGNESDEDNQFIELTFSHLTRLKIIGVKVQLQLGKEARGLSTDKEVLNANHLLSHLLGDIDPGDQSPNPNTKYLLNEIGVSEFPAWAREKVGFFFMWAQYLGGMSFPSLSSDNRRLAAMDVDAKDMIEPITLTTEEVCISKVKEITRTIQERIKSRLALQRQIGHLEKAKVLNVDLPIPDDIRSEFPPGTPTSRIRNWTSVNWEDYAQVEITKHLVESNIVDGQDFFYRLQINREPATLVALIAIKPDYPLRAPVFCLNLHWKKEFNSSNSERIRGLEMWINCGNENLPTKLRSEMLSIQIQRLLTSLDILLESWNSVSDSKVDFKRERMFIRPIRGRNRSLPLAYDPKLDVYTHQSE